MSTISTSMMVNRSLPTGNPWGAVAPFAHKNDTQYRMITDCVDVGPVPPLPDAPAPHSGLFAQSGAATAAAASQTPLMLLLLGNHDSSKTNQAETIAQNLGLVHIHMGDLIEQEISSGSSLGKKLKSSLDSGEKSPAVLLYDLVENRISRPDVQEHGFILDAYPEDFKHHKAETLLEELQGLRLIQLGEPGAGSCADCIPVIDVARKRGAYFQVDDEADQQDTADVLEALVDNLQTAPPRWLAVE